ncbi:hypothetical protein GIY23_20695 [Allosaccharopolyspora coralli]|uniref:Uncharacterized protein n=1 Tax=Allosaccharopolyspora coralli TaxID=2665642 RepID=A0A5Q3QJA7_9PSEU|nr:hypothetical protein GIY23_20695 [Allosaccharopolyspora coralli]
MIGCSLVPLPPASTIPFTRVLPSGARLAGRARERPAPWSAEVLELEGHVEVGRLQQLDDGLQVVLLLARDPELVALDLRLHTLRPLVADLLGDLLGDVLGDALLDLAGDLVGLTRAGGLTDLERLHRQATLDHLLLEDLDGSLAAFLGLGFEGDGVLARPADLRVGAPEVEPVRQLLGGLVQRVVDFLAVSLAHHIERRVCHVLSSLLGRLPSAHATATAPDRFRWRRGCKLVTAGGQGLRSSQVARAAKGS